MFYNFFLHCAQGKTPVMDKQYENSLNGEPEAKTVYVYGKKAKLKGFTLRPVLDGHRAETFGTIEYMDGTTDIVHSKKIKFEL